MSSEKHVPIIPLRSDNEHRKIIRRLIALSRNLAPGSPEYESYIENGNEAWLTPPAEKRPQASVNFDNPGVFVTTLSCAGPLTQTPEELALLHQATAYAREHGTSWLVVKITR